jgi:hypothetical protein
MDCFSALPVQEKKKVRGPTKKTNIFARQNKPKLKVEINEYGQPCGDSSTEFANFIGALVRTKGFRLAADDWRKVEARHKYKLWTDAQVLIVYVCVFFQNERYFCVILLCYTFSYVG